MSHHNQSSNQSSDLNPIFRIIKNTIFDSSLIIQLKILKYTTKQSIQKESQMLQKLLSEIKVDKANYLQIINLCLIIEYFRNPIISENSELKKFLKTLKNYDQDNLLNKSSEEFLIICNFIESFFCNLENVELSDLLYLQSKLASFENTETIGYSLFDKHYNTLKRHSEIRFRLIYDYYEILISYLIMAKERNLKAEFAMKVTHFIVLINDLKANFQPENFDVLSLMEKNVQIINANFCEEKEKISCYENLLQDLISYPKLKELQLVISFYLSDLYYKKNQYEQAIQKVLPMIKILKEEIFIDENPFATKAEIQDYLMLLFSRIINSSYYLNNSDIVKKYVKKLNKFISLIKKSKVLESDFSAIKGLLGKYECMIAIYQNILSLDMIGGSKVKKEITNPSVQSNLYNNYYPSSGIENKLNQKNSSYEFVVSFLEPFRNSNFLPLEKDKSSSNLLENQSLSIDEIHKLSFDKLVNYFMCSFEKQLKLGKSSSELYNYYMTKENIESLKNIKIYLDDKLLKSDLGFSIGQVNYNYLNFLNKQTNFETYFWVIIGYYNLIFLYHSLLLSESRESQKRLENYFSNLNGLCETFCDLFKKIFSPVLSTLQDNSVKFGATPGESDFSMNDSNNNGNAYILKMIIENNKIKNLLLKIFFIHINSHKYVKKYEEGVKLFENYERILLNFDLNDEISESLYLSLLKLKADFLVRSKMYVNGLNVYFEILRILDKKNDNFMEDRAIALFNTGFAYMLKMRNSVGDNPNNRINTREDIKSVKNYFHESLNLFETIKYNKEKSNSEIRRSYSRAGLDRNNADNFAEVDLDKKIKEIRGLLQLLEIN